MSATSAAFASSSAEASSSTVALPTPAASTNGVTSRPAGVTSQQAIHSAAMNVARGPGGAAALQAFLQTLAASKDKNLQQQKQCGMDLTSIRPLASLGPPKQSVGAGLPSLPRPSSSVAVQMAVKDEGNSGDHLAAKAERAQSPSSSTPGPALPALSSSTKPKSAEAGAQVGHATLDPLEPAVKGEGALVGEETPGSLDSSQSQSQTHPGQEAVKQ